MCVNKRELTELNDRHSTAHGSWKTKKTVPAENPKLTPRNTSGKITSSVFRQGWEIMHWKRDHIKTRMPGWTTRYPESRARQSSVIRSSAECLETRMAQPRLPEAQWHKRPWKDQGRDEEPCKVPQLLAVARQGAFRNVLLFQPFSFFLRWTFSQKNLYSTLDLFIFSVILFIWKAGLQRDGGREREFHPLVTPQMSTVLELAQAKDRLNASLGN